MRVRKTETSRTIRNFKIIWILQLIRLIWFVCKRKVNACNFKHKSNWSRIFAKHIVHARYNEDEDKKETINMVAHSQQNEMLLHLELNKQIKFKIITIIPICIYDNMVAKHSVSLAMRVCHWIWMLFQSIVSYPSSTLTEVCCS